MRLPKTMTTLALLLTLTACERVQREEARNERAEQCYQDAIARYKAGDVEAAEEGFRKAVRESPGNVSARFQLAVLLQEGRKDYLTALGCYRDCLLLAPDSDKARMARERAEKCELLFVKQLAEKYGYSKADELQKEMDALQSSLAGAQSDIVELQDENKALRGELDRIKAARAAQPVRPPAAPAHPATPSARPPAAPASAPAAQEVRPALALSRPQDTPQDAERGLRRSRELLADARGDAPAAGPASDSGAASASAPAPAPAPAPAGEPAGQVRARRYRVKRGDGLYSIARENYPMMPERKAVELIRNANSRSVTESLKPGVELILPQP